MTNKEKRLSRILDAIIIAASRGDYMEAMRLVARREYVYYEEV